MMRNLLVLFLFSMSVLSCSADEDKVSKEGEACTITANCATGLTCAEGVCADGTKANNETALEGTTLLVDKMEFTKEPEEGLNPLILSNLDQGALEFPIVILLDFLDIDTDTEMFVLRGGAGLKTDIAGEYTWDPQGDEKTDRGPGTISKTDGTFNATIELFEFIATSKFDGEIVKNTIPIRELEIDGILKTDENGVPESISDATIKGYITKVDGDTTFLQLAPGTAGIPLTRIFKDPNLNFIVATKTVVEPGDPNADAWYLNGKISAQNTRVK